MKLQAMIGYKLFKEKDDGTLSVVRIIHVRKGKTDPDVITIRDESDKTMLTVKLDTLKDYTPLEPDGLLTFNIATIANKYGENKTKDVLVFAYKILNIKAGSIFPFAVCRQCIRDVYHDCLVKDDPVKEAIYGMAMNENDCPTNFDYRMMVACNEINYTESFNFYRNDTLKDILDIIDTKKFDQALNISYTRHYKTINNPRLAFKKEHQGWCKDLKTLLKENSFQNDINEMLGITDVDFKLSKYFVKKPLPGKDGEFYDVLSDECRDWFSSIFKVWIDEANVLEYDNDINLGQFNNNRYFFVRDNTNKLYFIVYTIKGEYKQSDLEERAKKKDFGEQFRIEMYNKYNRLNNK